LTENALRRTKSAIEEFAAHLGLLPVIAVPDLIRLMADMKLIILSANLI